MFYFHHTAFTNTTTACNFATWAYMAPRYACFFFGAFSHGVLGPGYCSWDESQDSIYVLYHLYISSMLAHLGLP